MAKAKTVVRTKHPYIVKKAGVCGGLEIIEGTRMPVWVVAALRKHGTTPEEIAQDYNLPLSKVFDALSYYLDHQSEIEQQIEEQQNLPQGFWVDEQGFIRWILHDKGQGRDELSVHKGVEEP